MNLEAVLSGFVLNEDEAGTIAALEVELQGRPTNLVMMMLEE